MKSVHKYLKLFHIIAPEYTFGTLSLIILIILIILGSSGLKSKTSDSDLKFSEVQKMIFNNLKLEANAVYVYDVKNQKEIYSKNPDIQLPLASLTKIMMAVTAITLIPENTVITISPEFLKSEGDSGFLANEKWRLDDLLGLTLVESSNDGATAIASAAGAFMTKGLPDELGKDEFVKTMNVFSKKLGLEQTYFINPTGLDESSTVSGSYGSAKDVSKLMAYAVTNYPKLFDSTRNTHSEFRSMTETHTVKNTNTHIDKMPSLLASKTGFTDLAGGNLVIAFDAGIDHPIIVTVLGSSEQGRFEDVEKLMWATLDYISI